MNTTTLKDYLHELGLAPEIAAIYLDLIEKGSGTPLSIARHTGINRTKVYRLLLEMEQQKLTIREIAEHSTRVSPAPIERLQELLKHKQLKTAELSKRWDEAAEQLAQLTAARQSETRVKFYHGKSGIEQMVWNVLKAKQEIVGYTFRDLSDFVGAKFMSEFVAEFKRRNLRMRDIYGDEYREHQKTDYDWGEKIHSRYLPRKILSIPHQMDIYDDVVAFYSWNAGEVWGTEIYNEKVATMQRQLFELAWEKALKP